MIMALKKIRLELARTPEFPEGNPNCGYEFVAPLDAHGKLDSHQWAHNKDRCTVRRFWAKEPDEHGMLKHHRGENWAFFYGADEAEEEPIFRLGKHSFAVGEYLSVTEHDGVTRPFHITALRDVP
jgi:hypothetical protein